MAGIQGIGGIPEPAPERPATIRDRKREEGVRGAGSSTQDGVKISTQAQEAANVRRLVDVANEQQDVRPERVEEAKAGLERGDYQDMDKLREVARNLLKFLS